MATNTNDHVWSDAKRLLDIQLNRNQIDSYKLSEAKKQLHSAREVIDSLVWWLQHVNAKSGASARILAAQGAMSSVSSDHVVVDMGRPPRNIHGHGQGEAGIEMGKIGTESKNAPKKAVHAAKSKHGHDAKLPPELANFRPLGEIKEIADVSLLLKNEQIEYVQALNEHAPDADMMRREQNLENLAARTRQAMLKGIQGFLFKQDIDEELNDVVKAGNEHFLDVYHSVYHTIENSEKKALEDYKEVVKGAQLVIDKSRGKRNQLVHDPVKLLKQALATKAKYAKTIKDVIQLMKEDGVIFDEDIKFSAAPVDKSMLKAKIPGHAERTCDLVRGMAICKDMSVIHKFVNYLTKAHTGFTTKSGAVIKPMIERVRLKDRFNKPSDSGWRDFVDNFICLAAPGQTDYQHICELQIVHHLMIVARKGLPGHVVYGKVRNACEISLLYNGGEDKKQFHELFWKGEQQAALAMLFIKCKGQHWNPTQRTGWCTTDNLAKWAGVGLDEKGSEVMYGTRRVKIPAGSVTSLDLSKRKLEDDGLLVEMLRPLKYLSEIILNESSRHIRSPKNDDYQSLGDKELNVISSSRYVETRLIKKANFDFCAGITDSGLEKFSLGCPMLEEIELQECDEVSDKGVTALVANCKRLRRLNLKECDKITDEGLSALGKVDTLQELDLQDCDRITDNGLVYLKNMKVLNLNYCTEITDAGLRNVAKVSGSTLEDISLTELQVSDVGIKDLCDIAVNLKAISLYQCRKIGDAAVRAIAQNCSILEKADFQYCTRITSASLVELAKNCPKLKELKIRNCDKATDDVLAALQLNCSALERLDCFGCPNISEGAVQKAKQACTNLVVER